MDNLKCVLDKYSFWVGLFIFSYHTTKLNIVRFVFLGVLLLVTKYCHIVIHIILSFYTDSLDILLLGLELEC